MTGRTLLRVNGVRKSYGDTDVLRGVDLQLAAGEVTGLIGPSGSGKSTLLRCLNHLEKVDAGAVLLNDRPVGYADRDGVLRELPDRQIARQRRDIGMVFQQFNLFPHMTALENLVEAPVGVRRRPRAKARQAARELLDRVGVAELQNAYPRQLSGGQQQRVAIARALLMDPEVLLFDEPTSALDPQWVGEVLDVMQSLADSGTTMLVVTHEIGFVERAADTVVFLDEGAVVEQGPPTQVLTHPHHPRTRAFLDRTR